jgi:CheY-like chemotaxis protein
VPVSPSGAARDVCANSGEDALDKLAGGVEPTLIAILSDINMPGMDALDLLVKRRYPELPVMMVTAYAAGGPPQNWAPQSFLPSRSTLTC